eukprot:326919-Pleurochrysis_carterae.AAC.1
MAEITGALWQYLSKICLRPSCGMGLRVILKDPEVSDEKLFSIIPAPDFPSGGTIMGLSGARQASCT